MDCEESPSATAEKLILKSTRAWYLEVDRVEARTIMTPNEFHASLSSVEPPSDLSGPLAALWWDRKGEWSRAHNLVDELESTEGMAVHAYLHRREGSLSNADYWYSRAGRVFYRSSLDEEWSALVEGLLQQGPPPAR